MCCAWTVILTIYCKDRILMLVTIFYKRTHTLGKIIIVGMSIFKQYGKNGRRTRILTLQSSCHHLEKLCTMHWFYYSRKKRLKHNGLTLSSMCNVIDKNQANRKGELENNGAELLRKIRTSFEVLLDNMLSEDDREMTITRQHLSKCGVSSDNAYLYMQGHSIYNLVCRIGKALMQDDSNTTLCRAENTE